MELDAMGAVFDHFCKFLTQPDIHIYFRLPRFVEVKKQQGFLFENDHVSTNS